MSFFSYKNANADFCPGNVAGNVLTGLNKRVCIQVKNVFDSRPACKTKSIDLYGLCDLCSARDNWKNFQREERERILPGDGFLNLMIDDSIDHGF